MVAEAPRAQEEWQGFQLNIGHVECRDRLSLQTATLYFHSIEDQGPSSDPGYLVAVQDHTGKKSCPFNYRWDIHPPSLDRTRGGFVVDPEPLSKTLPRRGSHPDDGL